MKSEQSEPVLAEVVRAIELAGGPARVARALNVSTQTVCFYRDGERKLRSDHGATLEALTDRRVTRQQIWPQSWERIWPELAEPRAAEQGAANV